MGELALVRNIAFGMPWRDATGWQRVNSKLENFPVILYLADNPPGPGGFPGFHGYALSWKVPWDCSLLAVRWWAREAGGYIGPSVGLYLNDTSILTPASTLLVSQTHYTGAIVLSPGLCEGDEVRIQVDCPAYYSYFNGLYFALTLAAS
jgi:hypothetical protein